MTIRIDGTNTTANPGITGADADTGLQFGTDEVKIVTGGTDAITVDSSQNVGINTASPSTRLSVVAGSANGIELGQDSDQSTDSSRLFFSTSAGSNAIHSSSGILRFFSGSTAGSSSGSERMRILPAGGITFNGDLAAANALDDYEEGDSNTYTPLLQSTNVSPTYTLNNNYSSYVKIGGIAIVIVDIYLTVSSVGTGNLRVTLPFTCKGSPFGGFANMFGARNTSLFNLNSYQVEGYVSPGSAFGYLSYSNGTNGAEANMSSANLRTGTTERICVGFIYQTA